MQIVCIQLNLNGVDKKFIVPASKIKCRKMGIWNSIFPYIITDKVILWSASYSACVVYTKTIIHLSVDKRSGGYLPPLWWIIVNYFTLLVS